MTIQKILTPFVSTQTAPAAFKCALQYARHFKAHIDATHFRSPLEVPSSAYYPIAASYLEDNIATLKNVQNQTAAQLKAQFGELAAASGISLLELDDHNQSKGVTAKWSDIDPSLNVSMPARARIADMTVMVKPSDVGAKGALDAIEDLIFESGKPVLLTSAGGVSDSFPETVIVAWDGGREAARAVSAALPILREAGLVIVVAVGDLPPAHECSEAAATYLRLHDVHATHLDARSERRISAAEILLEHAQKKSADLLVTGAYSHRRWREVLLGGFTRRLLAQDAFPVLMSH